MKNVPESHHLHFTVDRVISLTTPNGMCIPYIVRLFLLAYLRMLILDAIAIENNNFILLIIYIKHVIKYLRSALCPEFHPCGCEVSDVSTLYLPSNASFNAVAGTQLPLAKNPCKNIIVFFISSEVSPIRPYSYNSVRYLAA